MKLEHLRLEAGLEACVRTAVMMYSSWCGSGATAQPAPRVGKPGGRRVGERVSDAFYPTWRAGSKCWRLAQNKAYYAVLAV